MICEKHVHLPLCILKAYIFKYSETNWNAFKRFSNFILPWNLKGQHE